MANGADPWYVRLPDGRTLRASNTDALRRSLGNGRIPWDSQVRRSPQSAWLALHDVPELAELRGDAPRREAHGPRSPGELRVIGVRGLVDELISAVDSTLHRSKLTTAAAAGLCAGLALLGAEMSPLVLTDPWRRWSGLTTAVLCIVVLGCCTSLITQMTYIELARLRPARSGEVSANLFRYTRRLVLAQVIIGALFVVPVVLLRWLPTSWVVTAAPLEPGPWREGVHSFFVAMQLLVEVLGWPIFLTSLLLLGPLVVVEDYSMGRALGEWLGLLRRHLGRIYLYEALAFVFGVVISVPLLVPLALVALHIMAIRGPTLVEEATLSVLLGLALTPLCAYMLVANVFIYLNLRYEFFDHAREQGR
jgi:hypothetical protein